MHDILLWVLSAGPCCFVRLTFKIPIQEVDVLFDLLGLLIVLFLAESAFFAHFDGLLLDGLRLAVLWLSTVVDVIVGHYAEHGIVRVF